jgi:hypothetical protein
MLKKLVLGLGFLVIIAVVVLSFIRIPAPATQVVKPIPIESSAA